MPLKSSPPILGEFLGALTIRERQLWRLAKWPLLAADDLNGRERLPRNHIGSQVDEWDNAWIRFMEARGFP
jgi:hypothetical protein